MNINLAAQSGVLRGHLAQVDGLDDLRVLIRTDESRGDPAIGIFDVGVAETQG
jgi:hypothetical protein